MLKDILKLKGAQELTKDEQKGTIGGQCNSFFDCSEMGDGFTWSYQACACVCESCPS